jgi:hypothetical protein
MISKLENTSNETLAYCFFQKMNPQQTTQTELCLNSEGIFFMTIHNLHLNGYYYSFGRWTVHDSIIMLHHYNMDSICFEIGYSNVNRGIIIHPSDGLFGGNLIRLFLKDGSIEDKSVFGKHYDPAKETGVNRICKHEKECIDSFIVFMSSYLTPMLDYNEDSCNVIYFNLPPDYAEPFKRSALRQIDTLKITKQGLQFSTMEEKPETVLQVKRKEGIFSKSKEDYCTSFIALVSSRLSKQNDENLAYRHLFAKYFFAHKPCENQ